MPLAGGSGSGSSKPRGVNLTCPICGKTFESKETLDAHKKMDHSFKAESPAGVG